MRSTLPLNPLDSWILSFATRLLAAKMPGEVLQPGKTFTPVTNAGSKERRNHSRPPVSGTAQAVLRLPSRAFWGA